METNPTLTFRPKNLKELRLKLNIPSLLFVLMGIGITIDGDWRGLIVVTLFSAPLIIKLALLLPNLSYIHLSGEGIKISTVFTKRFIKWYEVEKFACDPSNWSEMILIKYSAGHTGNKAIKNLGKAGSWELDSVYSLGHSPTEMVRTLNEWKAKYSATKKYIN